MPVPSDVMLKAVEALSRPELHLLAAMEVQAAIKTGAATLLDRVRASPNFENVKAALPAAVPENSDPAEVLVVALSIAAQAANLMGQRETLTMPKLHPKGIRLLMVGIASHLMGQLSDDWAQRQHDDMEKADAGSTGTDAQDGAH